MSGISCFSDLSIEQIKAKIKGNIGKKIIFYPVVDSTNTVALNLAEETLEGTVVISDSQYKGKGRLGRVWVSPPSSNIYMSIIKKPDPKIKDLTLLTIMASVGCVLALKKTTGLNVTIKWPNDLIVSQKKIGGILTEIKTHPDKAIFGIIGIGINVNIDLDSFPDDIRKTATSIKIETGKLYSRSEIIVEILNEIDKFYNILKENGENVIISEWKRLSSTLGKKVKVIVGNETLLGYAETIDNKGMLVLKLPSGKYKKISSGDITILR